MTQRLQIHFARGEEIKYVAHLDLMRAWERALRRAGIPMAYTQGFSPHPRYATAAPLPVGVTSEAEAMDLWLEEPMTPPDFVRRVAEQLPDGLTLQGAAEAPESWPPLAARLREAEYTVAARGPDPAGRVAQVLAAASLPWREERGGKLRMHDLRPLVEELRATETGPDEARVTMRLRAGPAGTGRPQEIVAALGLEALAIHRTRLVFAPPSS
ncbi:MAG: TIGR03936 family radical SAM-associated protein [Bacteroidetes bacterium]|nr:TIGR03936 family radical SAM-associated protein [Bacteroidota bacterium]MCL5026542.1 TIGR03936 family radical SAM-associated protein [Chloroflexota bacterium]